ncbi:MAG TPA: PIN domain-containing protein [Bryobacteraceae bacterium]|nr:PIN domain-containing protein [Bryobacteraceae bacterium]
MILVDTSIWLRFFMRHPVAQRLDALLRQEQVAGHELVYGELLIGDRGGRTAFLPTYEKFYYARTVPHSDVVSLVSIRKLHGRGVGWIDTQLLASALIEGMKLWTADPRFAAIAEELGVAWGAPHRVN